MIFYILIAVLSALVVTLSVMLYKRTIEIDSLKTKFFSDLSDIYNDFTTFKRELFEKIPELQHDNLIEFNEENDNISEENARK